MYFIVLVVGNRATKWADTVCTPLKAWAPINKPLLPTAPRGVTEEEGIRTRIGAAGVVTTRIDATERLFFLVSVS